MGGKSAAKAAQREAERARRQEEARQKRIRDGTAEINRIFDGGLRGTGAVGANTVYDPNATYYLADGSAWSPPQQAVVKQPSIPRHVGPHSNQDEGYEPRSSNTQPSFFGLEKLFQPKTFEQMAQEGKLFTGTEQVGGFNDEFYRGIRDNFTDYAMPQLHQQRDDAAKELTFSLARSGQLNSSARGQKTGELQRLFDINEQQVRDQALGYENQARTNVENARADLIAMLNATGDNQQAVNSALSRSTILTQPQVYSPLGQLFTDFTSGLGAQAAQERAAAASGGMYTPRYNTGLFGGAGRVDVRR